MIDPPPVPVRHPARKAACQLATDYAVQLIEEEAHLCGLDQGGDIDRGLRLRRCQASALTDGEARVETGDTTSSG